MAKAEYRSAIRSRKLIHGALADLLLEKPLDKITVTDIVNRADINRGTFYAHYADIPDVVHHIVEQSFCRITEALGDKVNCLEDIPGIVVRQIRDILEEDMDFFQKVMDSSASMLMQDELCNVMLDYLLAREAVYSSKNHKEYVFKLRFCAGGLAKLYSDWFAGMLPLSLEELTVHAEKLLMKIMIDEAYLL